MPILLLGRERMSLGQDDADRVRKIEYPEMVEAATKDESWAKELIKVLTNVVPKIGGTEVAIPIRAAGTLLAIAGFASKKRPSGASVEQAAQEVANAVRHLHEMDALRQDVEVYKFLMRHWAKSIVIVTVKGKVVGGTEGGLAVLKELQLKATNHKSESAVPAEMWRAIQADSRVIPAGGYTACVSHPPLFRTITTVDRLIGITFSKTIRQRNNRNAVANLTPAEQRVRVYLMQGDRNKEIADKLKISEHTMRHHVSAILNKYNCSDRLLLVAQAAAPPSNTRLIY